MIDSEISTIPAFGEDVKQTLAGLLQMHGSHCRQPVPISIQRRITTMALGNNDSPDSDFAHITTAVKEAAEGLLTCQRGIQQSIAEIRQSFDSPGTKGAALRDMLAPKIEALKNLSTLCNNGAKLLARVAAKATQGSSEQEVMRELWGASRFIADQLHSERADAYRILGELRRREMSGNQKRTARPSRIESEDVDSERLDLFERGKGRAWL